MLSCRLGLLPTNFFIREQKKAASFIFIVDEIFLVFPVFCVTFVQKLDITSVGRKLFNQLRIAK